MQFSLSLPSLSPPAAATGSVTGLQGTENYAEPGVEQGGLFALTLGQIAVAQPVDAAPVIAGSGPPMARLPTEIAADDLPPAGKPLPLAMPQTSGEELPPLTAADVAEPGDGLVPLPVLPQPLQQPGLQKPAAVTTARRSTSTSISTSIPTPTAEALSPQPTVVVRNASIEPDALRREPPASDRLLAVQTPDEFVTVKQNLNVSSPSVAPSPSLNPAPAPAPAAPAASAPPHAYTLNQPVADPQWGNELGKRLIWMNEQGIGRAELRMNPPELGPVEVRIAVSNDDARVMFQVQHGATREALENALPRLREMFAAQGLNLADASVSEHSANARQQAGQESDGNHSDRALGQLAGELADAPDEVRATPLNGSIDAYV